jgi:hypothetical protein
MATNTGDLTEVYKKYSVPLGKTILSGQYIVSQEPPSTIQLLEWTAGIIAEKDKEITRLTVDVERLKRNEAKLFDSLRVVGGSFNVGFQQLNGLVRES